MNTNLLFSSYYKLNSPLPKDDPTTAARFKFYDSKSPYWPADCDSFQGITGMASVLDENDPLIEEHLNQLGIKYDKIKSGRDFLIDKMKEDAKYIHHKELDDKEAAKRADRYINSFKANQSVPKNAKRR